MKIAFLCGSLEPGCDGVGDYVYKLGLRLSQYGHQILAISLKDRYIDHYYNNEVTRDASKIQIVRIPAVLKEKERYQRLKLCFDSFGPQWVSLQYVSYSFNNRGTPFRLILELNRLNKNIKFHIMFHEIWQGESLESTVKDRIIGFLQKQVALSLISILKPLSVSTTNNFYRKCFLKSGVEVDVISVFSNIEKGTGKSISVISKLPAFIFDNRNEYVIASFFGGFHCHGELSIRLKELSNNVRSLMNKTLVITHIGRSIGIESQLKHIKDEIQVETFVLGEWEDSDIADYLSSIDLGLSNYPKVLFEKSGTVSALLYNGCPVLFLKKSFERDDRKFDELVEWDEDFDIDVFLKQVKGFEHKYGIELSLRKYLKIFN